MVYSDYFNPETETMSVEQLRELQLERLQHTVRHCMNSAFYRDKFKELGITPDDIRTLDDVRKLPFTSKDDLREHYPFGLACVPLKDCVRLHSSSGTTGNPTVVLHTQKDLDEWANAVARCLWMVGSRPEDVFQNSAGYGMFTAGLGFQYGAEKVGMLTVPAAAGEGGISGTHALCVDQFRLPALSGLQRRGPGLGDLLRRKNQPGHGGR